tara:strand:+ start:7908 stop:8741 length:834 start_codon:yes stop_codon:yes gene_type:complete
MLEEYTMTMRGLLDDHQDLCLIPFDAGMAQLPNLNDQYAVGPRVSTIRILLCAKEWVSPRESVVLATLLVNSYELKFARPNRPDEDIRDPYVKSSCGELLSVLRGYANCLMLMGYTVWLPRASDIKIHQAYYDQEKEFEPKGMHFSEFKPCREVETNEFVICDTSDISKLFQDQLKNIESPIEQLRSLQMLTQPQTESEWEYWRKTIGDEACLDLNAEVAPDDMTDDEEDSFSIKVANNSPVSGSFTVTYRANFQSGEDGDKEADEDANDKPWWKFW